MNQRELVKPSADPLKRVVLMTILALAWVSSGVAWVLMASFGVSSPALQVVFGLNIVFHPVVFVIVWRNLLPLRIVDLSCLLFAAGICAACMALRLYSPTYGASIDLQPLYLWIPVIYVFAFTLSSHKSSLTLSLVVLALFVSISLPYLVHHFDQPESNFTIQLHMVSAVLIAALYFFSSYQRRFQLAQLTADELARLANTDELTELANRRRMNEAIRSERVRFERYGHAFSIILIDVDHFKAVNDRFGHSVGDQTLVALAARIMKVLRDVDRLGRWGGEEFIVILPETQFEETLHKATLLCGNVAAQPLVGNHTTTISCGVTMVMVGDTTDTLLQRADAALYEAKRCGRNRVKGSLDRQSELSLE
ncbi:MAG: GGDEF domain-containing protein [Thermosynechococcaceae cyanobacterium]